MNNKIALKLTLYFSAVLLVFALIIGGVFYQFFKQQTVEIKERKCVCGRKRLPKY